MGSDYFILDARANRCFLFLGQYHFNPICIDDPICFYVPEMDNKKLRWDDGGFNWCFI